jgi:hypothetical protein
MRGVFTYALLEALNFGPADALGQLTPRGIVGHLSFRVPELRRGDGSQRPRFYPPEPDGRIAILERVKQPPAANVTITFDPALDGLDAVLQDAQFVPLEPPRPISAGPWLLSLSPGTYVIRIRNTDISIALRSGTMTRHIRATEVP